ncbi:MAG: helix-turn-helix transcriptional regulator [Alicyclobacillus sp.]|nr:helix-turn-helix transcriptional regulator [Alicyclobacillus sp.]
MTELDHKKLVGKRLRAARRAAGLTQAEAARRIGVNFSTLSKYESGTNGVDVETLSKLAALYNESTDYLLFGENIKSNSHSEDPPELQEFINEYRRIDKIGTPEQKKHMIRILRSLVRDLQEMEQEDEEK